MYLIEKFITVKNEDEDLKNKYFNQVISILKKAYEPIGGLVSLHSDDEILEPQYLWKLVIRDGKVSACVLYKGDMHNRKLALAGTNGSEQGKKDLRMILKEDITMIDRGVWGELSGAMEHIYLDKLNGYAVPADLSMAIMHYLRKNPRRIPGDDTHYERKIGDNTYKKVMVGYVPKELANDALKDYEYTDYDDFDDKVDTKNPPSIQKYFKDKKIAKSIEDDKDLNEDRQVKFGNETFPKFGWCTILIGGPGSGKSTAIEKYIPINAKHYDKDEIKKLFIAQKQRSEINGDTISIPNENGEWETIYLDNAEVELNGKTLKVGEPYDLSNPRYVSFLHNKLRPISKKLFNQLTSGKGDDRNRLPNITFDMCGSELKDITDVLYPMKELGYKINMIWVLASPKTAVDRNNNRDRKGDTMLVVNKHNDVYVTMNSLFRDNTLMNYLDEFWVVMTENYTLDKNGRPNNCFKIDTKNDLNDLFDERKKIMTMNDIHNFIDSGSKWIDSFKSNKDK